MLHLHSILVADLEAVLRHHQAMDVVQVLRQSPLFAEGLSQVRADG